MNKNRIMIRVGLPLVFIVNLFILLHLTPNLALRTYVFFNTLHPISAVTTGIIDDKWHNNEDKIEFKKEHAKAYTLTKPPKSQNVEMRNYIVKKVGFLYFADYLGYY
ncbi:hypothetical protein HPT25_27260 [Bacillus sp. BRMEA1]|uniref:hypothetical protein n=1 Tax=Neobacillus endophyticus TaxID=2738405 RepID=UPI00156653C8|nr:hypothetical protein [Neobacillus endophyticus]NRD81022.1 hypothetical protein [Neobacillus endophyticus]